MTVPVSRQRRLQILDDETRDAARFDLDGHHGMSASEELWVRSFMARLAASLQNLGRRSPSPS